MIVFVSVLFLISYWNNRRRRIVNVKLDNQYQEIEKQRKEIVQQNEKLEKHNLVLSDLNNEKDTLMNIVAHDLRSPLNRIRGFADFCSSQS